MTTKTPRRALGRGLDALLPSKPQEAPNRDMFRCPIERISPRPDQPRQQFSKEELEELADTIREHGVLSPVLVRRRGDDRYEIIAGERRWRAAQKAGLKELPVVVKEASDDRAFEMALIENLQRRDLNGIEIAEAYRRLLEEHSYTQEQLAERVGKSRVAVTNALRLLKLPADVRAMVTAGKLSEGHARALLGAPDEQTIRGLAVKAVRARLSVRKLEQLVRGLKPTNKPKSAKEDDLEKTANVRDLEEQLAKRLGTRVAVVDRGGKGTLSIPYATLDELDRILDLIL